MQAATQASNNELRSDPRAGIDDGFCRLGTSDIDDAGGARVGGAGHQRAALGQLALERCRHGGPLVGGPDPGMRSGERWRKHGLHNRK